MKGFGAMATTLDIGLRGCAWVCRTLRSLDVVLGAAGAGLRVFLVEGDAFGFAHEGELDIDAVEEFGRKKGDVGCAGGDCGELRPVLGDERHAVGAPGGIEEWTGLNKIEDTFLLGAKRRGMTLKPLQEAEDFVLVVELVCDCGDRGSAEKIDGLVEAGFKCAFDLFGQG